MLKDKIVTINNNKENIRIANSVWHKILPFVLIISFMWLGFYQALLAFNAYPLELLTGSISSSFILEIVLTGLITSALKFFFGFTGLQLGLVCILLWFQAKQLKMVLGGG